MCDEVCGLVPEDRGGIGGVWSRDGALHDPHRLLYETLRFLLLLLLFCLIIAFLCLLLIQG